MDKKQFHEHYESIDVPKEEVLKAITNGIDRASKNTKSRKKQILAGSVAAAILIASGFMHPSVTGVMAGMPLVGQLFKDKVGENLAERELVTDLEEIASDQGIDVSITSAYYDGAVIGVTFDVKGKVKTDQDGRLMGFYEIFKGDETLGETKEIVYMESSSKGFSGHIQLSYPKEELPQNTSLPLEFKSIGEEKGSWKFNVPIKQLPYQIKTVNQESSNDSIKVQVDSIITGQASTAIDYTATFQSGQKHDDISLELTDDKGNPIHMLTDANLVRKQVGDLVILKGRTVIPKVLENTIEIQPKATLFEPDQFIKLNENTPVQVSSSRQELSVTVEKLVLKDKTFAIDFQVNSGDNRDREFMLFHDFARTGVILTETSRKEIYEEQINHKIETLDKKQLRFRSTFDLSELKNFHAEHYVLRFNLESLATNMPTSLEPLKIDLK
jgi:hypothetical protein